MIKVGSLEWLLIYEYQQRKEKIDALIQFLITYYWNSTISKKMIELIAKENFDLINIKDFEWDYIKNAIGNTHL